MALEPKPFRLLDLPSEIFLRICEFTVTLPDTICLHKVQSNVKTNTTEYLVNYRSNQNIISRRLNPPAITRASKLLRETTLPMFYELNVFHGVNWSNPRPSEWIRRVAAAKQIGMTWKVYVNSSWGAEQVATQLRPVGVVEAHAADAKEADIGCDEAAEEKLYIVSVRI